MPAEEVGKSSNRKALIFRLKEGALEEYKERHSNLPEEMRTVLTEAGIRNYTIWNRGLLLFAYFETDSEDDMRKVLENSRVYSRWRTEMEKYISIDDSGEKEWPMDMVFLHE